jgi:hypothetical protein
MRVNAFNANAAFLPAAPDRFVRGDAAPLPKRPGQALPPSDNLFSRKEYVPGDGERMQTNRAGSEDFLKIQSKGFSV